MQLDGLARRQHDVLSRDQAREGGLSDKAIRCRLRTGKWRRIHPGVYLTHSGEISWLSRASAAILHSGRGATLTLTVAAYLWGLRDRPPPMITLTVPYERSVVRMPGTRVRRRRREVPGVTVRRLPVTTVPVTVLDLSDEPGCTAAEAVALAALASQGQQTTAADLLEELGRRRRHRHRQVLRLALGDINEGIESVAEHHYVQRVERAHGLPVFARQTSRPTAAGELRRDFESLEFGIVVEIDGRTWHGGVAFTADRRGRQGDPAGRVAGRHGGGLRAGRRPHPHPVAPWLAWSTHSLLTDLPRRPTRHEAPNRADTGHHLVCRIVALPGATIRHTTPGLSTGVRTAGRGWHRHDPR